MQKRYTFESVRENSRLLRDKLLKLIEWNQPVDKEEKRIMLDLIDQATLGIGTEPVVLQMLDVGYNIIEVDDFQYFLRCLVEYDNAVVDSDFFMSVIGKDCYGYTYDICKLWKAVLFELNHFIPKALESAARMSKEVISDNKKIKSVRTVSK